jgi:hypothetical protein
VGAGDGDADVYALGGILCNGTPHLDAAIFESYEAAKHLHERGMAMSLALAAAMGRPDLVEGSMVSLGGP